MRGWLAWCALAACAAAPLAAQRSVDAYGIVTTHHAVRVGGRVLRYTARAGLLPIRDDDAGEVHARMFFVSYTLDRAPGAPARPLTFLWNGGPGSNAELVHLLGFGPKRVARARAGDPLLSPAGTTLVDNEETWLAFTDLVFVDPVGTGYSLPASAAYEPEFFTPRGDAESVAEFIRVWRTRYDAFAAPLFLAGESYGVLRAALVAGALAARRTPVRGVFLLSLALPLGTAAPAWRDARLLPSYTAAAWYHRRLADTSAALSAALAESEAWTANVYAPALARRDSLAPAARDSLATGIAARAGLAPAAIDRKTLTIPYETFANELLAARGLVVGHYDTRLTGARDTTARLYDPTADPSLKDILDGVSVQRYLRRELGYESDAFYAGPFGGGWPPPAGFRGDWMSVRWSRVAAADSARGAAASANWYAAAESLATAALTRTLGADPAMRVFAACGRFDLACAYFGNDAAWRTLPPPLAARVEVRSYDGGHAVYTDPRARAELARDARRFIESAAGAAARVGAVPHDPPPPRALAVTHHAITVHGSRLAYTARAGLLPIVDARTGEPHGAVFFVSYTLDRRPGAPPRPLTFLWNGGPGANATFVHLVGFGPRRIASADDPAHPTRAAEALEDNDATWLAFSDLVFVDPVGTGFSRPAKAAYGAEFYGTKEDIAAVAEFVRAYRARFDAYDAPFYLAGESFGAWRAAGVAEQLVRRGQAPAGVILISGGVALGTVVSGAYRTALLVPGRAATAIYHGQLAPALAADPAATMRAAEQWAITVYAPALERRDSLSRAQQDSIVAQLARFTGVPADSIDRTTLTVTAPQFRRLLLGDPARPLGRYDMRLVGAAAPPDHARLVTSYLRYGLGFYTDVPYADDETGWYAEPDSAHGPAALWAWDQGEPPPGPPEADPDATPTVPTAGGTGDGPPGGVQPWMRRAMRRDPALRAFVAAGLYDSLNGCADNAYVVAHVSPAYGRRYTLRCYAGGHMMYDVATERRKLARDVAAWMAAPAPAP